MSIASVQIMELPKETSPQAFVLGLREFLTARLHLVPYLTNVPQWSSGILNRPRWIKTDSINIEDHVYEVPVPAPGGRAQIEQTVAQLHEQPLPRSRPLWDLAVLTGIGESQVAYYSRVHHACLDGVSAQASTAQLMDRADEDGSKKAAIPAVHGKRQSIAEHVLEFFADATKQMVNDVYLAPVRTRSIAKVTQRALHPAKRLGHTFTPAPRTMLNRTIDHSRTFAMGEIQLDDVRQIAKSTGTSINDIFLSICGGALRRYLVRHNACPEQSLIAGCPVSMRKPGDLSNDNQVALMRVSLETRQEDPLARLRAIHASSCAAKEVTAELYSLMTPTVTAPFIGPATAGMSQLMGIIPDAEPLTTPPINVLISNVPGPRESLFSNGAKMRTHYPVSIPAHGVGVNITVQSYVDHLYFGITACAKTLPDAGALRNDMLAEWQSIKAVLLAEVLDFRTAAKPPSTAEPSKTPTERAPQADTDQQVA